MRSRIGSAFLMAGAVLLFSAAALLFYNTWDDWRAGQRATAVWEALEEAEEASDMAALPEEDAEDEAFGAMEIDGYAYIGVLSIPGLELELPVMEEWSYAGLKVAPGRYSGSAWTSDLIICGHNYERHFGKLSCLKAGDALTFTTIGGVVFDYEVAEVETLSAMATEEMLDRETDEWDLTLFTCTVGGRARVTVRCRQVDFYDQA